MGKLAKCGLILNEAGEEGNCCSALMPNASIESGALEGLGKNMKKLNFL